MMATKIFEIDAAWAEKWTKTGVSFLSVPTVHFVVIRFTQVFGIREGLQAKGSGALEFSCSCLIISLSFSSYLTLYCIAVCSNIEWGV